MFFVPGDRLIERLGVRDEPSDLERRLAGHDADPMRLALTHRRSPAVRPKTYESVVVGSLEGGDVAAVEDRDVGEIAMFFFTAIMY